MTAAALLYRLEGVRQTGPDRWIAKCPAHDDRTPSLAIRECSDGTLLLKCFAGDGAADVVAAVGMELSDLFPPRPESHSRKPERRPFPVVDIFRCLAAEITFLIICAADLERGEKLEPDDRERLRTAAGRFRAALDAGGIRR